VTLHHGDCIEVMGTFEPESIDAIVTDPPYGLEFMGKEWDSLGTKRGRHVGKDRRTFGDTGRDLPAARNTASPSWSGQQLNPKCEVCGLYKWGPTPEQAAARGRTHHKCICEKPEFRARNLAPLMQDWHEAWAREAFRVAKPGAHLLAFGGTRTYHRLAAAIEDAGWEIRDTLVWAYASGFPKSLDVSKAIDKAAGAERDDVPGASGAGTTTVTALGDGLNVNFQPRPITAPATDLAREWQGWGTALKPAWEPIVLARKPLRGTVAGNVTEYGTGALNIDGCRIDGSERSGGGPRPTRVATGGFNMSEAGDRPEGGRWPANVILSDAIFEPGVPGVVGAGSLTGQRNSPPVEAEGYSRFFLIPKAARTDREPVLGGLTMGRVHPPSGDGRQWDIPGSKSKDRGNTHPTVKPTDLMRHLVRLVTPPGGVVLDPFLGSGTTALAAEMEGFEWVGIEREAEYVAIAEARLNGTQRGLGLAV
jgi:DNA modification methylase